MIKLLTEDVHAGDKGYMGVRGGGGWVLMGFVVFGFWFLVFGGLWFEGVY